MFGYCIPPQFNPLVADILGGTEDGLASSREFANLFKNLFE